MTNGIYNYGLQAGSFSYNGFVQIKNTLFGSNLNTAGGDPNGPGQVSIGVTTDPTKSGIVADISSPYQTNRKIIKY